MTVINPSSISGITSITMASGGDDLLTIHSNNTTERVRVNNSGDVIVGSGVTLSPDGDVFATGVTTSTTFSGNFSGGTVSGTTGTFTGDVDIADKIVHTGDTNTAIRFPSADTVSFETGGSEVLSMNLDGLVTGGQTNPTSSDNGNIYIKNASSIGGVGHAVNYVSNAVYNGAWKYINSGTGATRIVVNQNGFKFDTAGSGTAGNNITFVERFNVGSDGDVTLDNGNLVIGTAGKGIDFSATAGGASTSGTSELLDDYEEGDHTVTVTGSGGQTDVSVYSNETKLSYHRIGNLVIVKGRIRMETVSYSGSLRISLPYTVTAQDNTNNAQMCAVATHGVDFTTAAGTGHHMGMFLEPIQNAAQAEFNIPRDNSSWTQATNGNIVAGSYLAFTLMYNA